MWKSLEQTPTDRQSEDPEGEAPQKRRKQENDPDQHAPVHFSPGDGSSDQGTKSVDDSADLESRFKGEHEGAPAKQLDDILLKMRDMKNDFVHVREPLEVLVRRERCAETKAECGQKTGQDGARTTRCRRCRARSQPSGGPHKRVEGSEGVRRQVVRRQGLWLRESPTDDAGAVQSVEVLTIGTDAWVQVVNDDARAQEGYRAERAWERDTWKAERDKGKANKVAQQERRAAALTAEFAAQSEKKTAPVCDQPPGLGELSGHIEAPNMEAGGPHPQATMMPDPWATSKRPPTNEGQTTTSAPPETSGCVPANKGTFALTKGFREAQSRSATRNVETRSMVDEAFGLPRECHWQGWNSEAPRGREH